jgi:hypothetical protein
LRDQKLDMTEELEPLPEATLRDYARAGLDAGIAAVPIVGGPLQVLLDSVLAPSLDRRRSQWLEHLAWVVSSLREKVEGFDLVALVNNETFVSAVVEASRVAIATHREEKLKMLRNLLVKVAMDPDRKDFFAHRYLRFVDELSPEHFLLLDYLSDPTGWFTQKGLVRPSYTLAPLDEAALNAAEFPFGADIRAVVLRDLDTQGLAMARSMTKVEMVTVGWRPLVTSLGLALLIFVHSPFKEDDSSEI